MTVNENEQADPEIAEVWSTPLLNVPDSLLIDKSTSFVLFLQQNAKTLCYLASFVM